MQFNLISLFPDFFTSPLQTSLMLKAQESGIVNFNFYNPRVYGHGVHKSVDDKPYGGGPGMVFMLEPLVKTLRHIESADSKELYSNEPDSHEPDSHEYGSRKKSRKKRILIMSPAGKPFTQSVAQELAKEDEITLICGRYEGIDARIEDIYSVEYYSMGDAVLNGGEVAALAMIEAISRLIPGFMGKQSSGTEESFSAGILEYPHYTRPEVFENQSIPQVLRSGNHGQIALWRKKSALERTLRYRPDLLQEAELNKEDAHYLKGIAHTKLGRNLYIALVHHPVIIEGKNTGTSSLTNLDVHDIARSCRTYGLGGYYIVQPLQDQQDVLREILRHWLNGPAALNHTDRAEALKLVKLTANISDVKADIESKTGQSPQIWGSSALWSAKKSQSIIKALSYAKARQTLETSPALLLLGTGHGLAPEVLQDCDGFFRPLRFLSDYNHLSVRAAAAILVDRILQDIF